jgi:hypothetical protein
MHRKRTVEKTVELEPYINIPNGAKAPRCQATNKRDGLQCGSPAVVGYDKCKMHGAGTRKRVKAGIKKDPGKRPEYALYGKTEREKMSVSELAALVDSLELSLDNSDRELTQLKAVLWKVIKQEEKFTSYEDDLENILEELVKVAAETYVGDPVGLNIIVDKFMKAAQLVDKLSNYYNLVAFHAEKIIKASKDRADTRAKLAHEKALENFTILCGFIQEAVWDVIDDSDKLDLFEDKLEKIYLDNGIVLEKVEDDTN